MLMLSQICDLYFIQCWCQHLCSSVECLVITSWRVFTTSWWNLPVKSIPLTLIRHSLRRNIFLQKKTENISYTTIFSRFIKRMKILLLAAGHHSRSWQWYPRVPGVGWIWYSDGGAPSEGQLWYVWNLLPCSVILTSTPSSTSTVPSRLIPKPPPIALFVTHPTWQWDKAW